MQLNKLLSYKEDNDFFHMHITSFLYLLFASLQVVTIEYATIFLAYLIIGVFTFIVFHFKQELQKNKIKEPLPVFNLSFFWYHLSYLFNSVYSNNIIISCYSTATAAITRSTYMGEG